MTTPTQQDREKAAAIASEFATALTNTWTSTPSVVETAVASEIAQALADARAEGIKIGSSLEHVDSAVAAERTRVIEEAIKQVPTNWLDPLLTGPNAVFKSNGPFIVSEIEALLCGVRDRIAQLDAMAAQEPKEGE